MATISGSFSKNNNNLSIYIVYTYTQSIANLSTTITAKLYVGRKTAYGETRSSTTPYSLSIGGSVVASGKKDIDMRDVSVGSSILVASATRTLSHTSSGTLYATISGEVDWSSYNPGKGTVNQGITFPSFTMNTPPYFSSSAAISVKENNSSGRTITGLYPENVGNVYLSWPAAMDKESTSGMTYVASYRVNGGSWGELWRGTTTYFTHNIGEGRAGQTLDYRLYAIDSSGHSSDLFIVSPHIQKNSFTGAVLTTSGSISNSSSSQTITIGKSGASNTYTGTGSAINYSLSANIGSTNITVYNATSSGNLTIVPGTESPSGPHIRLSSLRSALASSSYNGTLTLTLTTSNNWGSSSISSKNISVDLRANPVVSSGLYIGSESYFSVPNGASSSNYIVPSRKNIVLKWGAATDPNGTPVTYRIDQQVGNGGWTTLTSSTTSTSYSFGTNISGNPTYHWRVYAKNSYGREVLVPGVPMATLYSYSDPYIGITSTARTATEFTINFSPSISTEMPGNAIKSITLTYAGKNTTVSTSAKSVKLTGLTESSAGTFRLTIVDNHGATFGVSSGFSEGSIPQFYPVLSIRKTGVGVKAISDASADFIVGGSAKITHGTFMHSCFGEHGKEGYIRMASLKVTAPHQNAPMEFTIAQRGKVKQAKVTLVFNSTAAVEDVAVHSFTTDNLNYKLWIKKNDGSIFDIYIRKSESYDRVDILDFNKPHYLSGVSLDWGNTLVTSIPSGSQEIKSSDSGISLLSVYPVGSIYMSTSSANPSTYFGGTWVAWGSGRVPVGVDTSQSEFSSVEKTGGNKSESVSHEHTTKSHGLTTAEMPMHNHLGTIASAGSHSHSLSLTKNTWANGSGGYNVLIDSTSYTQLTHDNTQSSGIHTHTLNIGSTGSGNAHNHGSTNSTSLSINKLQPYITCYMWKRTA